MCGVATSRENGIERRAVQLVDAGGGAGSLSFSDSRSGQAPRFGDGLRLDGGSNGSELEYKRRLP
jgi:hypothetical protein